MHFPFGIPMKYYTDREGCPRYKDAEKKGKGRGAREKGRLRLVKK